MAQIPAQELDKLSEEEIKLWQGIAGMFAEAIGMGLRGVDASEARREDGGCPAGCLPISFGGPAPRPGAISPNGSSAILAPRCQAAGGGESLGDLEDLFMELSMLYHHWWILDWKVDIDISRFINDLLMY